MSDIKLITLIEYIKLHIISLEQDLQSYDSEDDLGYIQTYAAIHELNLILSTANGILDNNNL